MYGFIDSSKVYPLDDVSDIRFSIDFEDMTFDLDNNVYKPFCKENNNPIYKIKHSNHPRSFLKQLPKSNEKRISETSCNKDIFDESIKPYKEPLKESDFSETLNHYTSNQQRTKK